MQPTTHLFTIRIWQEEVEDGTYEWRGSIRSGIDGQVQYFVGLLPALSQPDPAQNRILDSGGDKTSGRTLGDVAMRMVEQIDDPRDR